MIMEELPFANLSEYGIETEFVTAKKRIQKLMQDNSLHDFLIENHIQDMFNPKDTIKCDYNDDDSFNKKNRQGIDFFNMISLNIRSLPKHGSELYCLLTMLKAKFSVVVLTEIGSRNISTVENLLPNYNFYYVTAVSNTRAGVGIYISQDLKCVNGL